MQLPGSTDRVIPNDSSSLQSSSGFSGKNHNTSSANASSSLESDDNTQNGRVFTSPLPMCVGWIDIMGSKTAMLHSLKTAASFMVNLHGDILESVAELKAEALVKVLPLMDGSFVVGTSIVLVQRLIRRVLRKCGQRFLDEKQHIRKFMVRSAIAWGNVIQIKEIPKGWADQYEMENNLFKNMMVGMPFVWSHESEPLAPPFGLYIHVSAREQTQATPTPMGWTLDKWWTPNSTGSFALLSGALYRDLHQHLSWIEAHPSESEVDSGHVQKYKKLIDEYFG